MARVHQRLGPTKGSLAGARRALSYLDGRSREGQIVRAVRAELVVEMGADPTAGKLVLVDLAAFALLHTLRLMGKTLCGEVTAELSADLRGWQRETRDTLRLLGLERVPVPVEDLGTYLARRAAEAEAPEPEPDMPAKAPQRPVGRRRPVEAPYHPIPSPAHVLAPVPGHRAGPPSASYQEGRDKPAQTIGDAG